MHNAFQIGWNTGESLWFVILLIFHFSQFVCAASISDVIPGIPLKTNENGEIKGHPPRGIVFLA